ncbi:caveolae-associated protein 2-like [Gymnodraco acuticeps]|uniref:Caveolae-associated protein 2-like n=1 Tax=Gymnodraco acuticeps TaxID=8218 RepID=A0A6P8VPJ8_GYMAC|nr:caveolae-associated protein 2-like [Gymnodraco acuticeps]
MVTTEPHQSQDLLPPPSLELLDPPGPLAGLSPPSDPEALCQGPVNAITVLTLLDKLVNMLDAVQENQNKMEVHQVEMEGVVRGIQADMTKLSKSHSHTSNTVSKLLDKSRKLSVTMKEVRDKMERQGAQVRKLEANHAHLVNRNQFKVLIFQEENEIPSSVYLKDPPPFPRDEILEEGDELTEGVVDGNRVQESGLSTIDLSSDEDEGLEAELEEEEEAWPQDLENLEKSRAEKLKRSSLKKVDSLKKAFSRQNIEKKMTKIGTKIVSQEQREKIKQRTSSLKVSPLTFGIRKPRSNSDSHPPDALQEEAVIDVPDIQVSFDEVPFTEDPFNEVPFTEVHTQLSPEEPGEKEEKQNEEEKEEEMVENVEEVMENVEEVMENVEEVDVSVVSEGVSQDYALSSTLPQQENQQENRE